MKVLIADKLSDNVIDELKKLGADVTMDPGLSADDLPGTVKDAEVLIVRSTKVTAATIKAAPALSLIIRAGAGVNTIDLACASENGIYVANCPGKNTDAVAEVAIGHLIACDRRIVNACCDLRNGEWKKKEYQKSFGLKGRTLGIIGLGSIGKATAKRAIGLEMKVIAWSRSLTPETAEEMGIEYCASPLEVAKQADAVSVHLAAKPETAHLINKEIFDAMKDGCIFVNTSRGEVVDTTALKEAIKSKGIRAGLDVFENEPAGGVADFPDTELASMVSCTPHIGASTEQASEATADEVVNIIKAYKTTGKPLNSVNIRSKSSAITNIVVRHFNKVGVLAGVLTALRTDNVNIEEMENTVFESGNAASCTLKLDSQPSDKALDEIRSMDNIIEADLK